MEKFLKLPCQIHRLFCGTGPNPSILGILKGKWCGRYIFRSLFWALLVQFILVSCNKIQQPPNVIILYADDMGYGDVGILNPDSKIPTPNIDRLAQDGLVFTDGHSSSGVCTPSRYAMLTGRHHWRDFHKIVGGMGPPIFKKDQYTLPQMFKEGGYTTACVGKWHLGWNWDELRDKEWIKRDSTVQWGRMAYQFTPEAWDWNRPVKGGPLDRGFDYYFGDGTINFPPYAFIENERLIGVPTVTMTTPRELTKEGSWESRIGPAIKDWDFYKVLPTVTRKAVEYVERQNGKKQPFFLYMAFPSPHAPIIPNTEFIGKSGAGPYGDFVHQTDWCIGQILDALDKIGKRENTIVIFSSDNGAEHYVYERLRRYNHYSSRPFKGVKRDLFEGGHHVPFIVRWPKKIAANTKSDKVINQVDLLKTFSMIIDTDLPTGLEHDSHDFSELFMGKTVENEIRRTTVHNTLKDKYAIRQGDWLYIDHSTGFHSTVPEWFRDSLGIEPNIGKEALYNLKEDIGQAYNLAEQHPEMVKKLAEKIKLMRQKTTFVEQ